MYLSSFGHFLRIDLRYIVDEIFRQTDETARLVGNTDFQVLT